MTTHDPQALAAALIAARRTGQAAPAAAHLAALPTDEQAYAVQDAVAQALGWFAEGAPRHWKSGGAARTATLSHAPLPPQGVRGPGASLRDLAFHAPAAEAEIALRLARAVTPEDAQRLRHEDALGLVEAMTVAIEIADTRWQDGWQAPAALRLADQGAHGALVLGEWLPCAPRDWSRQACELRFGTQTVVANTGAHTLGDPLWLLPAWLRHATRGGCTLPAQAVVTTGSWVGAVAMLRATDVHVCFAGLGEVSLLGGTEIRARRDAAHA